MTVVIQKKIPVISVKAQNGIISQNPASSLTLVNQGSQNSLSGLSDIVPGPNGGILTYDSNLNKYVVLSLDQTNTTLNGGEF